MFCHLQGLIPTILKALNARINKQLRFGYDVGKGYIMGEEEVHNFIDLMVDHKDISQEIKEKVAHGRTEIMKALGKFCLHQPNFNHLINTCCQGNI